MVVQETHRLVASCTPPTGDLAHNSDMCPDQELNRQHFGLGDDAQSTEPHQSGQYDWYLCVGLIF